MANRRASGHSISDCGDVTTGAVHGDVTTGAVHGDVTTSIVHGDVTTSIVNDADGE
jgi:hypothetical protein